MFIFTLKSWRRLPRLPPKRWQGSPLGDSAGFQGRGLSAALSLGSKQPIGVPDNFAGCFLGGRRSS